MLVPLLYIFSHLSLAVAGDDPDAKRQVPEGQQVFTGKDLVVGTVYEAFLIHFADRARPLLSPSRFKVEYSPEGLNCRNAGAFPIQEALMGKWHKVSFEVLALKETAVERPEGSGNWTWTIAYDCEIKGLTIAG